MVFFCSFTLILLLIWRLFKGIIITDYILNIILKNMMVYTSWIAPTPFGWRERGRPIIEHHLIETTFGRSLRSLHNGIACASNTPLVWRLGPFLFFFFFFFSLSSLNLAPAPLKFQIKPFNFFFFTSGPCSFDCYFFILNNL